LLKLTTPEIFNFVLCDLLLNPRTSYPSIVLTVTNNTPVELPAISYYPNAPIVNSLSNICANNQSTADCPLEIVFETNSLPFRLQTTSSAKFKSCTVGFKLDELGTQSGTGPISIKSTVDDYVNGIKLNTYEFSILDGSDISQIPLVFSCNIDMTKSPLSPLMYSISNNGIILKKYRNVVFGDDSVYLTPNCSDGSSSTCLVQFELLRILPNFNFSPTFSAYFTTIDSSPKPIPCPDTMSPPRGDSYVLYCQEFQKAFWYGPDMAALKNQVKVTLLGDNFGSTLPVLLTGVKFDSPFKYTWDTVTCADPTTPLCSLTLTSTYSGPPIQLHMDYLPYNDDFDSISCTSSYMDVKRTSGWSVFFPGLDSANISANAWVPKHDEPFSCQINFLLKFNYNYDYTNQKARLTGFNQYPNIVHRDSFNTALDLTFLSGSAVQFTTFPFTVQHQPNCLVNYSSFCEIRVIADTATLNPHNYPRSFSVAFGGADVLHLTRWPDYTVKAVNFVSLQLDTTIEVGEPGPENNFSQSTPYFMFELFSTVDNLDHFYVDKTQPAYFSITFRKEAHALYTKAVTAGSKPPLVPYWVSYGNAPLPPSSQPTNFMDPTQTQGVEISYRPDTMATFDENCFDPDSVYCTVSATRWGASQFTYFAAEAKVAATGAETDILTHAAAFRKADYTALTVIPDQLKMLVGGNVVMQPCIKIDWNVFKKDPNDPTEPIPTTTRIHFTKGIGTNHLFTMYIFYPNAQGFITGLVSASQLTIFEGDGIPTWEEDCSAFTSPSCTANYIFNNDIPPGWDLFSHKLPNGIIHSIHPTTAPLPTMLDLNFNLVFKAEVLCDNATPVITYDDQNNQISKIPTLTFTFSKLKLSIPEAVVSTLPKAVADQIKPLREPIAGGFEYPAGSGNRFTSDYIALTNTGPVAILRKDLTKPLRCSIHYVLHNVISRTKIKLQPMTMHSRPLYTALKQYYRATGAFIPAMGWTPIIVENQPDCTTQQYGNNYTPEIGENGTFCHLKVSLFGTPSFPMNSLFYTTDDSYSPHPLIQSDRFFHFYLRPVYEWEEKAAGIDFTKPFSDPRVNIPDLEKKTELDSLYLGSLGLFPTVPGRLGRTFNFTTLPRLATQPFVSWVIFMNRDRAVYPPMVTPPVSIPLTFNRLAPVIIPWFAIPSMIYGATVKLTFNQTSFSAPGNTIMHLHTNVNMITSTFETDFGFRAVVPCIQDFNPLSDDGRVIPYDKWLELLKIGDLARAVDQAGLTAILRDQQALIDTWYKDKLWSDPFRPIAATSQDVPIMGQLPTPQIVGMFMPKPLGSTQSALGTIKEAQFWTSYVPNPLFATGMTVSGTTVLAPNPKYFTGQRCMTYIPVNTEFPTPAKINPISEAGITTEELNSTPKRTVRHEFQILGYDSLGYGDIFYYANHDLPRLSSITGTLRPYP
jgi:hypothetical protein